MDIKIAAFNFGGCAIGGFVIGLSVYKNPRQLNKTDIAIFGIFTSMVVTYANVKIAQKLFGKRLLTPGQEATIINRIASTGWTFGVPYALTNSDIPHLFQLVIGGVALYFTRIRN